MKTKQAISFTITPKITLQKALYNYFFNTLLIKPQFRNQKILSPTNQKVKIKIKKNVIYMNEIVNPPTKNLT